METHKVCIDKVKGGYVVYQEGRREDMSVATTQLQVRRAVKKIVDEMLNDVTDNVKMTFQEDALPDVPEPNDSETEENFEEEQEDPGKDKNPML